MLLRIVSQVSVVCGPFASCLRCIFLTTNATLPYSIFKPNPLGRYLQVLTWEWSLPCRAYCDTGPWFLLADQNDHQCPPPLVALYLEQRVLRTYAYQDPHKFLKKEKLSEYIWLIKQIIPCQRDILFMNKKMKKNFWSLCKIPFRKTGCWICWSEMFGHIKISIYFTSIPYTR